MHGCWFIQTMCPASVHPCIVAYTDTNTRARARGKLHVSDKYTPRRMHRRCPLRSGPPPSGNNSKSRVINPSAPCLPSPYPSSFSLSARAVGVYACACGCLASSPSPVHPSLFVPNQFLPCVSVRTRTKTGMQFLHASLRDGVYVYDVHCCKLLPCYGRVPTGLIEDPLELP